MGYNFNAVANFLDKSPSYISNRMRNALSWDLDDVYKLLDFLKIPVEELHTYFPPNGGMPERGNHSRSQKND